MTFTDDPDGSISLPGLAVKLCCTLIIIINRCFLVLQVEHMLKMLNVPVDKEEVDALLTLCDQDQDGNISFAEFKDKLSF